MRLYGKARGLSLRTGAQTMLYLTCTTITNVDLTHYGISRAKVWVSVNCGTNKICIHVSVSNHDIIMGP